MRDLLKGLYKSKEYSLVDVALFVVAISFDSIWALIPLTLWIFFISPTSRVVKIKEIKTDVTEEK